MAIQSMTRGEMRRMIGRNLGVCIVGEAESTVDTSSLIDTLHLHGADDEHNNKQVRIYDATGSIVDGETQAVTDYDGDTSDATTGAFTESITDGDKYEMWETPWLIEDVDDAIKQAELEVSGRCLQDKETHTTFTEDSKHLYNCLSDFEALSKVEYEYSQTGHLLDNCETAWTAGTHATTTADAAYKKVGTYCSKNVIVDAGTTEILCYHAISSIDISDCDKIEFWMYSSIALTAGQLQIHLDDTAAIASALEEIDIPAMTAAKWYRHSLSLANPHSDTAIISHGIYQVANVADFTFYVDDVWAVNTGSIDYRKLPLEYWDIAEGSTDYLKLTPKGLSLVGANTRLRLTGYELPTLMTSDASTCEIDPEYIVAKATGRLLLSHAKSASVDIDNRQRLADYWLSMADRRLPSITTNMGYSRKV